MVDLASPAGTARVLKAFGIRPRRSFGQHFLVSRRILDRMLEAAEVGSGEGVLEVGAGIGTLTAPLALAAAGVVAVELDRDLLPALREVVGSFPNVTVVQGDAMSLDPVQLTATLPRPRKAVSNLPYNIASPLIVNLLERPIGFTRMVFTVQREVADRLAAPPGGKDYGALSVVVQYRAEARVITKVPRTAFYPPPAVESAVIRLEARREPAVQVPDEPVFFRVVKAAFAHRRKTLRNTLAARLAVPPGVIEDAARQAGIDPGRRGETLTLGEFASLSESLAKAALQR